jgi:hypothetical protein
LAGCLLTYDNKVVIYGPTPPRLTSRDIRRTMVLIKAVTQPGQDLFIRGGVDHAYGNAHGRNCPTTSTPAFGDPRYYNCAVRIEHRKYDQLRRGSRALPDYQPLAIE